jgi:hypothetical protein
MTNEEYIEHEVRLRVHDEKFILLEKRMDKMDNKLNWLIGLISGSIVIPVVLHAFKLL